MALSDERQRMMPTGEDREQPRAQTLAFSEAVLIVNPSDKEFKGEVYKWNPRL